jgi:myo-inositol-1(or 4)-monophosphatase
MRRALLESPLEAAPGTRARYSDLGYMLLGVLLERALGGPLDELARDLIFAPLQMQSCRFVRHLEGQSLGAPVAETEQALTQQHGGLPHGQVHDENAWAWGGAAGHAGLFGHAGDVLRFAQALLGCDQGPPAAWAIPSATVRWALSEEAAGRDARGERLGSHLCGVDTPSGDSSTAGPHVTRSPVGATVGHLGFTGTSVWVDRARRSAVVLLTNRVHPSREPEGMRDFRVRFHEAAFGALEAGPRRRVWPAVPWLSSTQGPGCLLPDRGRRELEVAREAALEAGALARSFAQRGAGFKIQHKGQVDLVTEADLACEAAIVERLQAAFPHYGVLAEEGGAQAQGATHRWIIDPIDGTTNFSHGVPHYCICIALEAHGQLQLGVIYDPSRDELFYASRGGGAWCNGRPLRVSQAPDIQRAVTVTGFPYDRQVVEDNNVPHLAQMIRHVQGMRRFGAAGLDLAWVAAGRLDIYWELRLKPWDMAAGLVLVEEAGGRLTAPDGGPLSAQSGDILATCGGLAHLQAVEVLRASLKLPPL